MDTTHKLKLMDMMLDYIHQMTPQGNSDKPIHVGSLNKPQGIVGFKVAEIGSPVFDIGDRYMIMLETLDGKRNLEVCYYKETLKPAINFYETV